MYLSAVCLSSTFSRRRLTKVIRHGPFDILGGGGLGFRSGPEFFFRTISEQGYFFRRPFGPDYFFHNQKL